MKKWITYGEAERMLRNGEWVQCSVNSRDLETVKTVSDLERMQHLKEEGILRMELYIEEIQVPEGAMQVSYDEAEELIRDCELVYYFKDEKEEEINNLVDLNKVYRALKIRVKEPVLYWYVD